jgi:hypothetical protein
VTGLRHPGRLHFDGQRVVVVVADPSGLLGQCRVLHDLASGDRSEVGLRTVARLWTAVPTLGPDQMLHDLGRPMGDLPGPRPGFETVVLAGPAVVGVHLRGDHDVAEFDVRPQRAGDADEE